MDTEALVAPLVIAVLGSGALTAIITNWFNRKNANAEAKHTRSETMQLAVEAALQLEERATARYHSVSDSLEVAQQALNQARTELRMQENYIRELHSLLDAAGISYGTEETEYHDDVDESHRKSKG